MSSRPPAASQSTISSAVSPSLSLSTAATNRIYIYDDKKLTQEERKWCLELDSDVVIESPMVEI
ncbi:hypothetical protein ES319_A04G090000v1 [Gossypium barbadense]|uniref:Uncharacterized protein n=2 Tax=Gossypium TaxID=3633 RepID=A0A5J5W7C5_GOSBA|nr:hypothetical protein ES319_A04G090000v1 [Gossypium barbadense]TYH22121.1 hypothetical protein ES288_A04G102100v1 [Gossypium darwinii]